ncbi:MAG: hypothetical protein L6R36_001956 [Xanthoria steineri]|nr:MAG: hypothetical protein L6R36_001956 [Xanthoria steineri]
MLYNLISVLFFCSFSVTAFAATPQVPIHPLDECPAPPSGWPPCGFRYPGIYRLINYGFQNAATLNDSTPGAAILSMPIKFDDLAQLWNIVFIDDSQTVMIINRATGAALTAVESRKAVQGVHVLPYDKRAHWTMDLTTFGDVDGVPIT